MPHDRESRAGRARRVAYAGRIRVEPHSYTARSGGQYLIVDETSGGIPMSILFEADDSRVTQFRSGLTKRS